MKTRPSQGSNLTSLVSVAKSQLLLVLGVAELASTPSPRLFGRNPSLDLLAHISFELSNKLWIDWRSNHSNWFLKWLGVSADFTVLRMFFSAKTPTVWGVYEGLCRVVSNLQRPAPARVLFEIQDIVTKNNPTAVNGFDFLKIAVQIGSKADGMLDIARRAFERSELPLEGISDAGRHRFQVMFLAAAARQDLAMMSLLRGAVAQFNDGTYLAGESTVRLIFSIICHLYDWDSENPDEVSTISEYIELLIQVGLLKTGLAAQCCIDGRPKVAICYPATITIDELVMICPPGKRESLYAAVARCSNDDRCFVSKAGVFTAALKGVRSLEAYLKLCHENDCFELRVTLQESLLFATCLNDVDMVSVLLQMGVDPEVSLLSKNQERYQKGHMPWNPMFVAATSGYLEILKLLSEKVNIVSFLSVAPLYEIVQYENAAEKFGQMKGRELRRLENLYRRYLYSRKHDSDADVASALLHMHSLRTGKKFAPGMSIITTAASLLTVEKGCPETISWIRDIATAHGMGQRMDKELIEVALFHNPETRILQCRNAAYQPCDVLLLEGLVEANAEYHQDDLDLLQLSIRAQCSLKVVEFLLSKGFRVHSRPAAHSGNTMLHDAILSNSHDRFKIVELLLREGADHGHCGMGLTVLEASLHRTAPSAEPWPVSDDVDMFKYLFAAGAPVRHWRRPELERWRPLTFLLLQAGAEDDLIIRVADAGADLNDRGWDNYTAGGNKTPLQKAISRGRESLAQELIKRGAYVHAHADRILGSTALQTACGLQSSLQFVEYLVKVQGADVNEPPSEIGGMTSLQGAASRGFLSLAEFLLAHGADVNALSGKFGTLPGQQQLSRRRALDFAAMMGRLDMTEFLLKAGGRSGAPGLSGAIYIAKENRHFAVLSVLLEWEREHGSRILREEAEWQEHNPELARLLLVPWGEDDFSDDSYSDSSVSGDSDE